MSAGSTTPSVDDQRRQYAWEWFKFHADQRLRAFNYFLLVVGALTAGVLQAVSGRGRAVGVAIGVLGVFVSVVFFALEVRNTQLVNLARDALRDDHAFVGLIKPPEPDVADPTSDQGYKDEQKPTKRKGLSRHKVWLRMFIVTIGALSAAEAVWAGYGYPSW